MTKLKAKAGKKKSRAAAGRGARKPVNLDEVRRQISDLVGRQALDLVQIAIAEADKGHYAAMKYLFELIGLYPAAEQAAPDEDSLAKTLLQRLGPRPEEAVEGAVTKDSAPDAAAEAAAGGHTVE